MKLINTQFPAVLHILREYPNHPDVINKVISFTEVCIWNIDIWWNSEDFLVIPENS
ncbi:hypothetical protein [Methanohalobium evestigatum]|uniref:hypothetical protein n=1 Tax=Methanohalobium evestigatum TaxID=2322 RepID=UPI0012F6EAD8|nr:hypothetical protein [Methanohalobium evestigatum]